MELRKKTIRYKCHYVSCIDGEYFICDRASESGRMLCDLHYDWAIDNNLINDYVVQHVRESLNKCENTHITIEKMKWVLQMFSILLSCPMFMQTHKRFDDTTKTKIIELCQDFKQYTYDPISAQYIRQFNFICGCLYKGYVPIEVPNEKIKNIEINTVESIEI